MGGNEFLPWKCYDYYDVYAVDRSIVGFDIMIDLYFTMPYLEKVDQIVFHSVSRKFLGYFFYRHSKSFSIQNSMQDLHPIGITIKKIILNDQHDRTASLGEVAILFISFPFPIIIV